MQSVIEAWTHEADPTVCLFSEEQLKANFFNKVLVPNKEIFKNRL